MEKQSYHCRYKPLSSFHVLECMVRSLFIIAFEFVEIEREIEDSRDREKEREREYQRQYKTQSDEKSESSYEEWFQLRRENTWSEEELDFL